MWEYSDVEHIKIFRKILNWEWYKDSATKDLFLHCLLKANWKTQKWQGIEVCRGQFVTSLSSLKNGTGLTTQQIRTALTKLKSTGEITIKTTNKYSIITVVSYDSYQANQQAEQQTNNKQTTNKQQTSNNRYKNNKNIKEREESNSMYETADADTHAPAKGVKTQYGENGKVLLTAAEYEKLNAEYGAEPTRAAIAFLDEHIAQTGYKTKSHYYALRRWVFSAVRERELKQKEIEQREARLKQYSKKEFDINNWTPEEG